MQELLLLLPVLLPVVFWAAYHYYQDRHLPEPGLNLAISLGLGVAAAGLSKLFYVGLGPLRFDAVALAADNPAGLFLYAVLAIGPIEELSKLLPFVIVVLRFKAFDEPMDGIIYASFIALGYAAVENIIYLQYLTPLAAAARGFASPVVHIVFASIWAHPIAQARLRARPIAWPLITGFSIAALLHGAYDFLVLLHPVTALPVAAALIAALWVGRLILMRRLHREATGKNRLP